MSTYGIVDLTHITYRYFSYLCYQNNYNPAANDTHSSIIYSFNINAYNVGRNLLKTINLFNNSPIRLTTRINFCVERLFSCRR